MKAGRVLEGGAKGSWDERGIGTRHVVFDAGKLWMIHEGVDGAGRHRLGLATSEDGGMTWKKEGDGAIFAGREGEEGAWDEGNVGTPYVVKKPGGGGWYLYYVGTSASKPPLGKVTYAIGCAESCQGLAGPWVRVDGTC